MPRLFSSGDQAQEGSDRPTLVEALCVALCRKYPKRSKMLAGSESPPAVGSHGLGKNDLLELLLLVEVELGACPDWILDHVLREVEDALSSRFANCF